MGRFRASLIECVGAVTFNRRDAKTTFEKRLGVPPTKEILDTLEDEFNRGSFMIQINKDKNGNNKRNTNNR